MPADPLPERRKHERKAKSARRQDLLFLVSRHALDEYLHLKRVFADDIGVTVIFDRRWRDRRETASARDPERRRADRRSPGVIDDRLRRQRWAMVRLAPSVGIPNRDELIHCQGG
jgi:hypothetical protein